MKTLISILSIAILFSACNPPEDNSAKEAFERNSQTVLAYLTDWQSESLDYDKYFSDNAYYRPTAIGTPDSLSIDQMKEEDKIGWATFDFQMPENIQFLPGVNAETKEMDGSVRYYGDWTISWAATEDSEAGSVVVKVYDSFDFDENGKIVFVQTYGDWGGITKYMMKSAEVEAEAPEDEPVDEEDDME